jgi:cytochrome P450
METLRVFSQVVSIPKWSRQNAPLVYEGRTYILPEMHISINAQSLHTNPKYWGPDAREFKPQRWLNEDGTIKKPEKGTFVGFSDGVRACVGRGFAEVEFCAAVCKVLSEWRLEPGEGGRERAWKVLNDSTAKLSLNMNEPMEIKLVKRKE